MSGPRKVVFVPKTCELTDCGGETKLKIRPGTAPRSELIIDDDGNVDFLVGNCKTDVSYKAGHYTVKQKGSEVIISGNGFRATLDTAIPQNREFLNQVQRGQDDKITTVGFSSSGPRHPTVSGRNPVVSSSANGAQRDSWSDDAPQNVYGHNDVAGVHHHGSSGSSRTPASASAGLTSSSAQRVTGASGGARPSNAAATATTPRGASTTPGGGSESSNKSTQPGFGILKLLTHQSDSKQSANTEENAAVKREQQLAAAERRRQAEEATRGFAPSSANAKKKSTAMLAMLESNSRLQSTFAGNGPGKSGGGVPPLPASRSNSGSSTAALRTTGLKPSQLGWQTRYNTGSTSSSSSGSSHWLHTTQSGGRAEGMINLGNTCYMSAVAQALCALPGFSSDLLTRFWSEAFAADEQHGLAPDQSVLRQLTNLARLKAAPNSSPLNLSALKAAVAQHFGEFRGSGQQDAQEFLVALLDRTHDECLMYARGAFDFLEDDAKLRVLEACDAAEARAAQAASAAVKANGKAVAAAQLSPTLQPREGATSTPASSMTSLEARSNSNQGALRAGAGPGDSGGDRMDCSDGSAGSPREERKSDKRSFDNSNDSDFDDGVTDRSAYSEHGSGLGSGESKRPRKGETGSEADKSTDTDAVDLTLDDDSLDRSGTDIDIVDMDVVARGADDQQQPPPQQPPPPLSPLLATMLPTLRHFRSEVRVQLMCVNCGHKPTPRTELHSDFSLELDPFRGGTLSSSSGSSSGSTSAPLSHLTLRGQICQFFADEERELLCEQCSNPAARAVAQPRLAGLPGVLSLHLKRFKFDHARNTFTKVKTPVQFPVRLQLPHNVLADDLRGPHSGCGTQLKSTRNDFVAGLNEGSPRMLEQLQLPSPVKPDQLVYTLKAVVRHEGSGAFSGHYICDTYNPAAVAQGGAKTWLRCNDSMVTPIDEATVLREMESPYVLMYVLEPSGQTT